MSRPSSPNPDLVNMEDDGNTSPNNNTNNNNTDNEQASFFASTKVQVVFNLIAIGIFLGITLSAAEMKEQYLSALALVTPILAICKLASDKGGFDKIPLGSMMSRFTVGFVLLLPLILILCLLWSAFVNFIFHFSVEHLDAAAKWDLSLINMIIALVLAEETTKLIIYVSRDKRDEMEKPEYFIYYSLSTAMGLTTAEIYFATFFVSQVLHSGEKKELEMSEVAILAFIFTGFLVPMQCLGSYYVGLAAARVQLLKKKAISEFPLPLALTVLFRTCFLLSLFVITPYTFAVGIVLAFACYLLFLWIVLRYQNTMPVEYLRSTGHLNLFGYGALASGDDSEGNNNQNQNTDAHADGEAPGSTVFAHDEDEDPSVMIDGETSVERNARLAKIRNQEMRMKRLQEENERNKIEVVIPPVVTSLASNNNQRQSNNPGGDDDHHPSSVTTMFDNVGVEVDEDEANQGEELQEK